MGTIPEVKHLSFACDSQPILSDVDFSSERGDSVAIIGISDTDKNTLMKLLLAEPSLQRGEVTLFGQAPSHFHDWPKIGYIPQNGTAASENFSATTEEIMRANLYPQTRFLRLGGKRQHEQTHQALESVSTLPYAKRVLNELSDGRQQRMMLARVLAVSPRMMLLDEPTTGVDAQAMQSLYELLGHLNHEAGLAIVMITHNAAGAMNTVSQVLCLEDDSLVEPNHAQLLGEVKHRHKYPILLRQIN